MHEAGQAGLLMRLRRVQVLKVSWYKVGGFQGASALGWSMLEGKPLSQVTYADLDEYLREGNEEGTRLDYKREAVGEVPRIACAFTNTAGGHLILGIDEKRGPKGEKSKRPDPDNVPGLAPKDWEASLTGKIRDRTRPPVVPEVKALTIPGRPEMIVVVRVEESADAPHEVHVSSGPEIPIRRADDTKSAGLDDVERMIYRRDRLRSGVLDECCKVFMPTAP